MRNWNDFWNTLRKIFICFCVLLLVTTLLILSLIYYWSDNLSITLYLIWLFVISFLPVIYQNV